MFVRFWANAKLVVCSIPTTSPCWDIWDDDMAPIRKGLCTRGWTLDPIPIWFLPTELNYICFSSPVIPMLYTTVLSKVAWKDAIPCWHIYIYMYTVYIYMYTVYIYIYVCVCVRVCMHYTFYTAFVYVYLLVLLDLVTRSEGNAACAKERDGHCGPATRIRGIYRWRQMLDNYST